MTVRAAAARRFVNRHPGAVWATAAVLTVLVTAAIPLLHHRRYYFYGNTQVGSFGQ